MTNEGLQKLNDLASYSKKNDYKNSKLYSVEEITIQTTANQ